MNKNKTQFGLAILIGLFFIWGFTTILNDILIPYLKGVFELSHFQANLVQFAFFGAYFIGSIIYFLYSAYKGDPINKLGYKNGIIAGLLISGLGCLLFVPASLLHSFGFFLSALFVIGFGFTILQIAANPFVTLLGDPDSASSRLNLAQGFNSFGTTIAPILGGILIFGVFATGDELSSEAVKWPYLGLACLLFLMAIAFRYISLPSFTATEPVKGFDSLKFPSLTLGAIAIFCYVGAEVAIGSNLVSYLGDSHSLQLDELMGSKYLSFYWGGAMIGRFLGAVALKGKGITAKQIAMMLGIAVLGYLLIYGMNPLSFGDTAMFFLFLGGNFIAFLVGRSLSTITLSIFALINIALLLLAVYLPGNFGTWALLSIGLFNSIMWSNIFSLAISRLGKFSSQGSSLLVMMIVGGAVMPPIQGFLADQYGIVFSFLFLIIPYAYIAFYGFYLFGKFKSSESHV